MQTTRHVLPVLLAAALVAPFALANHTPPASDTVDGGTMSCKGEAGRILRAGAANDEALPRLRATDNGHLAITAAATAGVPKDMKCLFEVRITGATPQGLNPQGGLTGVTSTPCSAAGAGSCTAQADADWWVTFADPLNGIFTHSLDITFDLVVDGVVVDSGAVHVVDPSLPALVLP